MSPTDASSTQDCGTAAPGCEQYLRISMLPVDSDAAAANITNTVRTESFVSRLMAQPGYLWSTGMYDNHTGYVFPIVAYAYEEQREFANSNDNSIGRVFRTFRHLSLPPSSPASRVSPPAVPPLPQAWSKGIEPMFADFHCPCPMGFSPNTCPEGVDWITSGEPGTPTNCAAPGSGCLGGETCMCTSNEDCSNCAPSEGAIQGPVPGPDGAHMKINSAPCITSISGVSAWTHWGRSPAGGAISRGVDPHQEAWLSASFDTWFLQAAADCAPCGVVTVCFGPDADGNPAPIAPDAENYDPACEVSICSDINSICYQTPPGRRRSTASRAARATASRPWSRARFRFPPSPRACRR